MGNIFRHPNSLRDGKNSKTGNAGLLSAAVIVVLLCWASESRSVGAPSSQSGKESERASIPRGARQDSSPTQSAQRPKTGLEPSIPDVDVFDQDGNRIHFYSDLIKDKVVVISFLFTTCKLYCPMQGENLSKLQGALGARLGRDVNLITVSVDPETDTPERLKAWGAMFGAKPGWTFVTGAKPEIDKVSMALTGAVAIKGDHSAVVYIGNDKTGIWTRAYGLHDLERFSQLIEEVANSSPTGSDQK
jgi:cytochrome oxidase Cu insertion factor (SCO1/SenC/PrrC family)